MVGTVVALAVLGAAVAALGSVAGAALGKYWRLGGGITAIVFGLAALHLLPFKLPKLTPSTKAKPRTFAGAMLYGLAMGGASTACSVSCNPLLAGVFGVVTLQANPAWGAAILAAFAVGYSITLAAGLVGVGLGLGKLRTAVKKIGPYLAPATGVMLIAVGFYMLATV